jgi:hypothetical protein
MNRSESIVKIASALVKAQAAMGNAVKDAKNPFFKSNYADLNAVREACLPALNANGVSVLQPTVHTDGKAYVETVLLHESGEFISSLTEILCAKQNDPQAHGSGISYARRYGLQSLVNLGSADDDGEGAMGRQKQFNAPPQKNIVAEVQQRSATVPPPVVTITNASPTAQPVAKKTVSFNKPKPTTSSTPVQSDDIDL